MKRFKLTWVWIIWLTLAGCNGAQMAASKGPAVEPPRPRTEAQIIDANRHLIEVAKDDDQAMANLEQAVRQYPQSSLLWYWLGVARERLVDTGPIIEALERSLELGLPREYHLSAYKRLASAWILKSNPDAVVRYSSLVLLQEPGNVEMLKLRAWSYDSLGTSDPALSDYEAVLKLDPGNYHLLKGKAWILLREKRDYATAAQLFQKAVDAAMLQQENSFLSYPLNGLGWAAYYQGHFQEAIGFMDRALPVTPDFPDFFQDVKFTMFLCKALCYAGLDRKEEMRGMLQQALKFKITSTHNLRMLAMTAYGCGQEALAWEILGGKGAVGMDCVTMAQGPTKVLALHKNGPAQEGGLQKKDILQTVNGEPVSNHLILMRQLCALTPGTRIQLGVLRNQAPLTLTLTVGSMASMIQQDPLLEPLKHRQHQSRAGADGVVEKQPGNSAVSNVAGMGKQPAALSNQTAGSRIQLNGVTIDPQKVTPGGRFDVVLDFIVNDPQAGNAKLTVTMNYTVAQNGKVLKRFEPKSFQAPNNERWRITRQPKAAKAKGTYTLQVELIYQDQKAMGQADFTIQ